MKVLIVGATSGIGLHLARQHAARGDDVFITARDGQELDLLTADLTARYQAKVVKLPCDLADVKSIEKLKTASDRGIGTPDRLYMCAGISANYPDFAASNMQLSAVMDVNAKGSILFINSYLQDFLKKGSGDVVGVSSVAALKGKGNNPVYSATKAALNVYLEGLRNAFSVKGLNILTVYPGFTDTSLTFGMDGLLFLQSPEVAATSIIKAADQGKQKLYTPNIWALVMLVFKYIPDFIWTKKPFVEDKDVDAFKKQK